MEALHKYAASTSSCHQRKAPKQSLPLHGSEPHSHTCSGSRKQEAGREKTVEVRRSHAVRSEALGSAALRKLEL